MANVITLAYRNFKSRLEYSAVRNEAAVKEMTGINDLLEGMNNVVDTSLDKGDSLIMGRSFDPLDMVSDYDLADLDKLRTQSRRLWYQNAHGHGVIRNLIRYIGIPTVTPKEDAEEVKEYWRQWWVANQMNKKWKEILRRNFRDGETFIRWFDETKNEDLATTFRFIEPSRIREPSDITNASHGIETENGDIETPVRYWKLKSNSMNLDKENFELIDADEIYHIKIGVDSDVKRGRPILEPVMRLILSHETWLRDRIVLNKIRTAIALVKKIDAPRETVERIRNAQAATGVGLNSQQQNLQQVFAPGSLLTANRNVNYEFLSPKLDARDVKEDGRNILLAVTAGMGQSEVLVTGDASNQNFASSLVAEGPVAKEVEDWRAFHEEDILHIYKRVILDAVEAGILPETVQVDREDVSDDGIATIFQETVEVSGFAEVSWPQLTQRNIKQESEALAIHKAMGIASVDTLSARAGYDPREERKKRRRDARDAAQLRDELGPDIVPTEEEEVAETQMMLDRFQDRVEMKTVIQKSNGDEEDYDDRD